MRGGSIIVESRTKTAAQVALRWNPQRDAVTLAKSARSKELAENLAACDFELSEEEMGTIARPDL